MTGRIVKGVGGLYEVEAGGRMYTGKPRGVLRNLKVKPVIGDMCRLSVIDEKTFTASIEEILERKNEIVRPRVANIDQIIVVMAVDEPRIDINLLDRYLTILENGNFNVVICVNKTDLSSEAEEVKTIYEAIGYEIIFMNTVSADGFNALKAAVAGKITAFAGPSGVGKSSIINLLSGHAHMETGGVSRKIARGKHTTRHVELIAMGEDTFVMDTPGFTSLEFQGINEMELSLCFREFRPFLGFCYFRDCLHLNEPDCAVKNQIGQAIEKTRYMNYVKFVAEIKENNMRLN